MHLFLLILCLGTQSHIHVIWDPTWSTFVPDFARNEPKHAQDEIALLACFLVGKHPKEQEPDQPYV